MTFSITIIYIECNYAECRNLYIVVLNAIALNVVVPNVIRLSVVMPNVTTLSVVVPNVIMLRESLC